MGKYTLNNLESLTGIKYDTIRMWERRYDILSPHRTQTNRRRYTDDDLVRLINISILYRNGMKISRIASMTNTGISEMVESLSLSNRTSDDLIGAMVIAMNRFDEAAINELLLRSFTTIGFEATFTGVVFPFLHRVGVLWHTGSVNVGTEHFITGVFRRRLMAAIDALPLSKNKGGKRFLLFLPEGELHEMGLLFYAYLIIKRQHKVLYLGQSTPLSALVQVAGEWDPDYIVTSVQSGLALTDPVEFLQQLGAALKNRKILATGLLAGVAQELKIPGISPLRDEKELACFLGSEI